jgi:hypothetical protein
MVVVIALVSFAAGTLVNRSSEESVAMADVTVSPQTSKSRSASAVAFGNSMEAENPSRRTGREITKTPTEPQISIPLSNLTQTLQDLLKYSDFDSLDGNVAKALLLLGVPQSERDAIHAMLLKVVSEAYAQEKICLKAVQISETEIKIDHKPMEAYSKTIQPQIQDGIRSLLRADLADALISSIKWDRVYPVNAESDPTFSITRSTSHRLTAWVHHTSGHGHGISAEFADDGIPIPADRAFTENRWRPLLKGLTLLPRNEK